MCDRVIQYVKYPNMPCIYCFLTAILIQHNPANTWYTLMHRTMPNMNTVFHPTPYSYIKNSIPSTVHHHVIPPEDISQPQQEPLLWEQHPFTEDPDFHFQEILEDIPFTEFQPFPPRTTPMSFSGQFAAPEDSSHNIVTKVHQTFPSQNISSRKACLSHVYSPNFPIL